jgi:hypothetical protein
MARPGRVGGRAIHHWAAIACLVATCVPSWVLAQEVAGAPSGQAAASASGSATTLSVASQLQQSLQALVSKNLLSSFSGADYSAGPAMDRLAAVAADGGTAVEDLNLAEIAAAVAKRVGELVAPLFEQMDEIGGDFDALVLNSRDKERKPAEKCGAWPEEQGWLKAGSAFAYPSGAQRIDRRPTEEFCSFFPPMQDYIAGMQDMPAVHAAQYATPKGEFLIYNLRDRKAYQLPDDYDAREQAWYKESSTVRKDVVLVVKLPRSLKITLGAADALRLVESAFNTTLSFLSDDDFFQLIVSGYSSPCFPPQYLVLASEANKLKVLN